MSPWFGVSGALLAALAVGLGAFGAHGLRDRVSERMLSTWETAASYQLWHGIALVLVALVLDRAKGAPPRIAGWSFLAGIGLFSGSLYMLVLTGKGWLGAVTPLGGIAFIVGWVALAIALWPTR